MRVNFSQRTSAHIIVGVCLTVIVVNAIELAAWTSLRWQWDFEPESDWEEWKLSALRVVFGLVFLYMLWSCVAALVGLVGALKRIPSYLRFFRDCTIVDLVFSFLFTLITSFCASRPKSRALICEQLSRQPELLRNVGNTGLTFENCEVWFENSVLLFVVVMLATLIMRVQFTFTLSNFYSRLLRKQRLEAFNLTNSGTRRILLLPPAHSGSGELLVYAPVNQTPEIAHELGATEAWISSHDSHQLSRRTGQIQLDIEEGEGLLPDRSRSTVENTRGQFQKNV